MRKRVLILSEAFGSGHTSAAVSLMEGIHKIDSSVEVKVLELGKDLHPFTYKVLNKSYLTIIEKYPSLWRRFYTGSQQKASPKWYSMLLHTLFFQKLYKLTNEFKPDAVICTHPFSNCVVSKLKSISPKPFTFCTVVTELHLHSWWVNSHIDYYLVSNQDMYSALQHLGTANNQIKITGMPTRPGFWTKEEKAISRQRLGLEDRPTILVMGGGLGLGGIRNIAEQLANHTADFQLVICTGHNLVLRRYLENNLAIQYPNILIIGYVSSIDIWMDASDVLITKPGGATCFEALMKSIPMIIFEPISGHEEKNLDFLTNNNLAFYAETEKEVLTLIKDMLFTPENNDIILQNVRAFKQKIDPSACPKTILQLIHSQQESI